jgi:transcriptional regulator with XRE-family HTH domain
MITGTQVRMARAALKWGVRDLAERAKVSPTTISHLEGDKEVHAATLAVIEQALRAAGVEFIDENGGGPGVRLPRRSKASRQRHNRARSVQQMGDASLVRHG